MWSFRELSETFIGNWPDQGHKDGDYDWLRYKSLTVESLTMCDVYISLFSYSILEACELVALKQQIIFSDFGFQKSLSQVLKSVPKYTVFLFEIFKFFLWIELFVFNWQIFWWHSPPFYLWPLAKSLFMHLSRLLLEQRQEQTKEQ